MSSVASGTMHTNAQTITDDQHEDNEVVSSENRHVSADDVDLYEHMPDEELLRRVLQVEQQDLDRDREFEAMASSFEAMGTEDQHTNTQSLHNPSGILHIIPQAGASLSRTCSSV